MFNKDDKGIGKIYKEVLLLFKFLQTKIQVKNKNIGHYDLYYTVVEKRDEKEFMNDEYENI